MPTQQIQFAIDKNAALKKVDGRQIVSFDTTCWINMADGSLDSAIRVRQMLSTLVSAGQVVCPLSWGTMRELFTQSGDSLKAMASLMEELSLNVSYVNREELYAWELSQSINRLESRPTTLEGLFAPPMAYVGSCPSLFFGEDFALSDDSTQDLKAFFEQKLSQMGLTELALIRGGSKPDRTPPAYSDVAKEFKARFNGDRKRMFREEAEFAIKAYVLPNLMRHPDESMKKWAAKFSPNANKGGWIDELLKGFPALHNFVEVMVAADQQPSRKDKYNHFMDNEIVVAPLAYSDAFVSTDKGIRDMLKNRTKILNRTKCVFFDSFESLQVWLDSI